MPNSDRGSKRMTGTYRRRIVVCDVHGELGGLTEILLHAGIVDRSKSWVGGDTVLIQTGDVIDRGPHSRGAVSLLRHLQREATASSGKVVRGCGNHELWLLQGDYSHTNFSDRGRLAGELRQEIEHGLLQAAYSDGARLFTHAGLRSIVRQILVEEIRTSGASKTEARIGRKALADHINATFKSAVQQNKCLSKDHCLFWVGNERGGRDKVGGIFWCDYTTIASSERAWDIPQVFGHTPALDSTLRHAHGLKLINVDAGMCETYGGHRAYLEITADGTTVQHCKQGKEWSRKVLLGGLP